MVRPRISTRPVRVVSAGLCLALAILLVGCARDRARLTFATTTSVQDSGILDALTKAFERDHPEITLKVVTAGSGEVLALGRGGDADVMLVHSPADELAFMRQGQGVTRKPVMHNRFLVVGPSADPARVAEATSPEEAFRRIAASSSAFVSRGDGSGTHKKELEIWDRAGADHSGSWYLDAGQGQAETISLAGEKRAYLLTDSSTFVAVPHPGLGILFSSGANLVNHYSVIVVRGVAHLRQAKLLSDWLVSERGQRLIATFGNAEFGHPSFEAENPH